MTEKNKWSNVRKGYKDTKINKSKFKDVNDEEIKNKNIYDILDSSDTYLEIENKKENKVENKVEYKVETIYTDSEKGKIILNSYPILSDVLTK
jgi:hypothetical protein